MAKADLTFNSPIEKNSTLTYEEEPFNSCSSENNLEGLDFSEQDVRRNSVYGPTFLSGYEHSSLHDIEAGLLANKEPIPNYEYADSSEVFISREVPLNIHRPTDYDRYSSMAGSKISSSSLSWYVGMNPTLTVLAKSLKPNGNIGSRMMSKEPMSIVMNFGISNSWAYIDWNGFNFSSNNAY